MTDDGKDSAGESGGMRGLWRLFEQAPGFITIMRGPAHVVEFVNDAHRALFDSDGWLGLPIREAAPSLDGQGFFERLDRVYATGIADRAVESPVRYRRHPDGPEERRYLNFIYAPLLSPTGVVEGVFCEGFDATPQHDSSLAQREKDESQAKFRTLFECSAQFAAMLTPDGRIIEINRVAADDWAHVRERFVGVPFWSGPWWSALEEERRWIESACQVAAGGRIARREVRCRFSEGVERVFDLSISPVLDEDGRVLLLNPVGVDVSESRRIEGELRGARAESDRQSRLYEAILTNTPDLAYVWNLDHRFIYANDVLLRMWGRTREEAIGRHCLELGYEPWHAAMHDREIDQVVATRQPLSGTVPFTGAFGRRQYEYILVPVVNEAGEVEAVAGTTRDVTERQDNEEQLRKLAAQLAEADRLKTEFLAMLAHELRNPLAPIGTAALLLAQPGCERGKVTEAAGIVQRQVAQLSRLVDDLIDVSRMSRGEITLRRAPVDLSAVVDQAVESSMPMITRAGQTLTVRRPEGPLPLVADGARLTQVISNLLNNASKFSDAGRRIELEVRLEAEELALVVRDEGIGIAADMLPRVFDMFVQAEQGSERARSGLGLGLALVRRLTELHGGQVSVHSDGPGSGSVFTVQLPRQLPAPSPADVAGPPQAEHFSGRRVLIVDDNTDAADAMAMLLEDDGNQTAVAYDGVAALRVGETFGPDIVLLDLGLPGFSGYEVCRRLREALPKPALMIALTGWGDETHRQRSRDAGFDAHLVKPLDQAEFARLVARHLRGASSAS